MRRLLLLILMLLPLLALESRPDLDDPSLTPEQREELIERQEDLWNMDKRPVSLTAMREGMLEPIVQTVIGGRAETLTFESLQLSVPEGAFRKGRRIRIAAIVLDRPEDFVFSPVPMVLQTGELLESTGMFRLSFTDEGGRPVRPLQPLSASMPAVSGSDQARVYRYTGSAWQEVARSAQPSRAPTSLQEGEANPFGQAPADPNTVVNPANPSDCWEGCGFQIYDRIDSEQWWNFDIPKPDFTCVAVEVDASLEGFEVQAAGVSYQGISYGIRSGNVVQLNMLKNKEVKIWALQRRGQSTVAIGSLPVLRSPDVTAHTKSKGGCRIVGRIEMKPLPITVMKKREAFLKAINWPGY